MNRALALFVLATYSRWPISINWTILNVDFFFFFTRQALPVKTITRGCGSLTRPKQPCVSPIVTSQRAGLRSLNLMLNASFAVVQGHTQPARAPCWRLRPPHSFILIFNVEIEYWMPIHIYMILELLSMYRYGTKYFDTDDIHCNEINLRVWIRNFIRLQIPWTDLTYSAPKEYVHGLCYASLCSVVDLYQSILLISFRVASVALGQSYDCPIATEATLKNMGKCIPWIHQN